MKVILLPVEEAADSRLSPVRALRLSDVTPCRMKMQWLIGLPLDLARVKTMAEGVASSAMRRS